MAVCQVPKDDVSVNPKQVRSIIEFAPRVKVELRPLQNPPSLMANSASESSASLLNFAFLSFTCPALPAD